MSRFGAAALLLGLLAIPATAGSEDYWLPRLPVTVRLQAGSEEGLCASRSLVQALSRRTFLWTLGPNDPKPGWEPDFLLCPSSATMKYTRPSAGWSCTAAIAPGANEN